MPRASSFLTFDATATLQHQKRWRAHLFHLSPILALILCACHDSPRSESVSDNSATSIAQGTADSSAINNSASITDARPDSGGGQVRSDKSDLTSVHAEFQDVDMHIEPGITLRIARLRGTVMPLHGSGTPALNDKASMLIAISSADIVIDTLSLATLMNRHVFGYARSPLKKLHLSVFGNELIQTGTVHKLVDLPFRIRAALSVTEKGEIRIHPTSISIVGMGVSALTRRLGGLGELITIEPGHGARIEGNDFILNVEQMLPPPKIRGTLSSIRIVPSGVRQAFGTATDSAARPLRRTGSAAKNFMYFHGGTLRFGKLTMRNTDLEIVDADESNPFDYDLDRYQEHLVQGRSNSTMVDGLIVHMPDIAKLAPRKAPSAGSRAAPLPAKR